MRATTTGKVPRRKKYETRIPEIILHDHPEIERSTETEWGVFLFVFEGMKELTLQETSRYAHLKENLWMFSTDFEEMSQFLGTIFCLSSYNKMSMRLI